MSQVDTGVGRLEYEFVGPPGVDRPTLVFLHEGLGSVAMWRDFPTRLAEAAGCRALVYSRRGYGRSEALSGARTPDFMHYEATVVLPALLERLDVHRPILFGHSDGGSIALIHAASAAQSPASVVAMAPHVMVESLTVESIAAARDTFASTDMPTRLARYHDDAHAAFRGWCDIWLDPAFRDWSIEDLLPRIACPVLAIQGEDDIYGTMAQIDRIAAAAADVELLKLPHCGHSPQRDAPEAVIEATVRFIARCGRLP